jgi:hypothetical protein
MVTVGLYAPLGAAMEIVIEWEKPVQLTRHKRIIIDENELPPAIEAKPAVYFFSRHWGGAFVPFYIGETWDVRARLKAHLQSKRIADVLRGIAADDERIKSGTRYFHYGYFVGGRGQRPKPCLRIVQRYLIRKAVEEEVPILNSQLKTFRTHTLRLNGGPQARAAVYPKSAMVEAD